MEISIRTAEVMKRLGDRKGLELLSEAGFTALDYGMDQHPLHCELYDGPIENFDRYFENIKHMCDELGLKVGQAHSPSRTFYNDPETDEYVFGLQVKSIRACAIMECPYIVIHPNIPSIRKYDIYKEETKELNMRFYSRLLPYLKEYGVKLAIENMFHFDEKIGRICPTVCSSAEEMIDFIDTLNDEHFVACLDIGHCNLLSDPAEMLRKLGSYTKILHIHDNNGISDQHIAPYLGTIKWDEVLQAMHDVGYDGTFNLETEKMYSYSHFFECSIRETVFSLANICREMAAKLENIK